MVVVEGERRPCGCANLLRLGVKGSGLVPFDNLALDGLVYSMISLQSKTIT